MPSSTVEDYLKTVYIEELNTPDHRAKTVKIAEKLNVTPGTATVMLKHLTHEGYITYYPRRGCCLTDKGKNVVVKLLRKHRLIELFLQRILHFDWSEVHEEAERMEHCFSDKVINRLNELLDYPKTDPHGEIIPEATGFPGKDIEQLEGHDIPLTDAEEKHGYTISRITNQDPGFLQFMKKCGLLPGAGIIIEKIEPVVNVITIHHTGTGKKCYISLSAARFIFVTLEK